MTPELTCLALYRVSHYCFARGHHRLAAFLYRVNITLTGADIHPASVVGPSCLLVHPVGTVLFGTLGERATIYARVIVAPDLPVFRIAQAPRVGDDVVLGSGSTVLGDVQIAPHCHIAPASLIDMSIHEAHSMISRMPGERLVRKRIPANSGASDGVPG